MNGRKRNNNRQGCCYILKRANNHTFPKRILCFLETAEDYVNDLIDGMYMQLHSENHYEAPAALKHYGNYYVKIKGSKRTTWYVFFDKNESRYFIEFITNNHTPHSAYLNKL